MLRISLIFLSIGIASLFFADLEITSLSPQIEFIKITKGFLIPSFTRSIEVWPAFSKTLFLALSAVIIGSFFGFFLSFFYYNKLIRAFCTFIRSIHELFWALLLIPLFGLSEFCGVLAIAIPFTGVFAKIYREIFDETDKTPELGVPVGTNFLSRFLFATFPLAKPAMLNYTKYRIECGLRSSAVLGFIGIPTVGFYLEIMFSEGFYREASGLLYMFFILVIGTRAIFRWQIILPLSLYSIWVFFSTFELAKDISGFFVELLPWPMRGEQSWTSWSMEIFEVASRGIWHTFILGQASLVLTAIFALIVFPFSSKTFFGKFINLLSEFYLLLTRNTPEFFIAYLALILLGPSILPGIIALTLHNGAILAHLAANLSDQEKLPIDFSKNKFDRYSYWVLPKIYGQFLSFLFYRWELIIKESALLGILGITTLGFYIDSAIHNDHLDKVLALIILSGLFAILIDYTSQKVRQKIKR